METGLLQSWLMAWAFTAPRVLMVFAVLPILTEPVVPQTLRNGIILILSLYVLPLTHEQFLNIDINLVNIVMIVAKEALLGLRHRARAGHRSVVLF